MSAGEYNNYHEVEGQGTEGGSHFFQNDVTKSSGSGQIAGLPDIAALGPAKLYRYRLLNCLGCLLYSSSGSELIRFDWGRISCMPPGSVVNGILG